MNCSMIPAIYAGDSLILAIEVLDGAGPGMLDLAGATVEAVAYNGTASVTPDSITVTNAAAGEIAIVFDPGALGVGDWSIQTRVTLAGDVQTVSDGRVKVVRGGMG